MDDLISRQNALRAVMTDVQTEKTVCLMHANMICKRIEGLPAVDAVPVRCKDCKYWREHKYAKETRRYIPFCGFNAIYTKADDFCSRGERREEDGTLN